MTGAGQRPEAADPQADPKADLQADALETVAAAAPGPATTSDSAPAAGTSADATADGRTSSAAEGSTPLLSLSSLLGGEVEGGAACAADGTCD